MDSKESKYKNRMSGVRKSKDALAKTFSNIGKGSKERIEQIDAQYSLSDNTRKAFDKAKKFAVDNQLDIAGKNLSTAAISVAQKGLDLAKEGAKELDERLGASQKLGHVSNTINRNIVTPFKAAIRRTEISSNAALLRNRLQSEYGEVRAAIKTYPVPSSIEEQLILTREELVKITSCILQMNSKEAESWIGSFGKLISSKTAGIVTSGTLLGLVSAFGTAGTGTAIASLSGAASTSASLAWVGGWVGGGMAAGAILTAGIGILAGIAAFKFLGSKVRQYDDLSKKDKALVETVGMLVTAIDDSLSSQPVKFSRTEAETLISDTLIPLYEEMIENADDICSRLDLTHSLQFREHLLWDFEPVVIDGFKKIKRTLPIDLEATVGGVFYALLSGTALDGSIEQQIVVDAIRRSRNGFEEASELDISTYLSQLSPAQLQGYANNVKGISHELLFVHNYNGENGSTFARVMESTNHPGTDVEIVGKETGEVLRNLQLKAVSSRSSINSHYEKYPDSNIEVLSTIENAGRYEDIQSSGISNAEITQRTETVIENMASNTIFDRSLESAEIVGLVSIGKEAISVLQGKSDAPAAISKALSSATQAAVATAVTAFLFS